MEGVARELADSPVLVIAAAAVLIAVVAFGRSVSFTLGKIHAELKPNGGSSVKDAVDRIEAHVKALAQRVGVLEAAADGDAEEGAQGG